MFKKTIIFSLLLFSILNVSNELEEEVILEKIDGIGYTNEANLLTYNFNTIVDADLISSLLLKNVETNREFGFKYICNRTDILTKSLDCLLDLGAIPTGTYYAYYTYNNVAHRTNVTLQIIEREEKLPTNDLQVIYDHFEGNKRNQVGYFLFRGKTKATNFAYIVMTDENSKRHYVKITDCKIVDTNLDYYDLKCLVDLSKVSAGKYRIIEYYIDKHHGYCGYDFIIRY